METSEVSSFKPRFAPAERGFLLEGWVMGVIFGAELIGTMALYQNSVLKKHLASQDAEANTPQSEIDRIDNEIDQMVYELYG